MSSVYFQRDEPNRPETVGSQTRTRLTSLVCTNSTGLCFSKYTFSDTILSSSFSWVLVPYFLVKIKVISLGMFCSGIKFRGKWEGHGEERSCKAAFSSQVPSSTFGLLLPQLWSMAQQFQHHLGDVRSAVSGPTALTETVF